MDKKYINFIHDFKGIVSKKDKIFEFLTEDLLKIIKNLENQEITKNYNEKDWEKLFDYFSNNICPALILALINSPHLPETFHQKIYEKICDDADINFLPLFSEYTPNFIIKDICYTWDAGLSTILADYYSNIPNNNIRQVCDIIDSKTINNNYLAYKFLEPNLSDALKILRMIENENQEYFDDNTKYELFLTHIINNKMMPDEIRNNAFEKGYIPNALICNDEFVISKLYKMYADTFFELDKYDTENLNSLITAKRKILSWIKQKKLPTSCQIDFINRIKNLPKREDYKLEIIKEIISKTQDLHILRSVLSLNNKDLNKQLLTNKYISGDILNALRDDFSLQDLAGTFIRTVFYNSFSLATNKSFLTINNEYLTFAVLASVNTGCAENYVIPYKNIKNKEEQDYLNKLKFLITGNIKYPLCQKIICYATKLILDNEYSIKKVGANWLRKELYDTLNDFSPDEWTAVNDREYEELKFIFTKLSKDFPTFSKITEEMFCKLERVKKVSELCLKYPNIFKQNKINSPEDIGNSYELKTIHCIPCYNIDVNEISFMTNEEKQQLLKDIIKVDNNQGEISEYILTMVISEFDYSWRPTEQNSMFKYVDNVVDFYDTLKNDLIKRRVEKDLDMMEK